VTGCTVAVGPGATTLGTYPKALRFSAKGQLKATLPIANLNTKKFCVRLVFKVDKAVTARQVLTESNAVPFSLYLITGTGTSDFHLVSAVTTSAYGLGKASTEFFTDLHLGTWYAADLVYDTDTLAVFVDGIIYSVHAFPDGTVAPGTKEILASLGKVPTAVDSFPPISKNYIHTTRGLRSGRLQYGLKQGLTQLILTSETAAGEAHTVQVKDLGTHTNAFTLKGYRDKLFSLQVHNKLGAGKDHLRISIDGIPLVAGGEVKINVKPGIGGVELVSAGQEIKATVSFEYVRRGTELNSKFELKEQNGLRVVPSTFITANQLKVSRINTLFGDS
jgi:hypothetical protein